MRVPCQMRRASSMSLTEASLAASQVIMSRDCRPWGLLRLRGCTVTALRVFATRHVAQTTGQAQCSHPHTAGTSGISCTPCLWANTSPSARIPYRRGGGLREERAAPKSHLEQNDTPALDQTGVKALGFRSALDRFCRLSSRSTLTPGSPPRSWRLAGGTATLVGETGNH